VLNYKTDPTVNYIGRVQWRSEMGWPCGFV